MNYIVYLSLDNPDYVKQSITSIKSLLRVTDGQDFNYQILIYTNLIDLYKNSILEELPLTILYKKIDKEKKQKWLGKNNYIYRLKILTLIDCVHTYGESAIFMDTDTFFISSPNNLFLKLSDRKNTILHCVENNLYERIKIEQNFSIDSNAKKFYSRLFLNKKINFDQNTTEYILYDDMPQWNSGVIGIHPASIHLLYEALKLSDSIYDTFHIRTAEQFSLSCVFQMRSNIIPADLEIFHYWFMKEVRYVVEESMGADCEYDVKYSNTPVMNELRSLRGNITDANLLLILPTLIKIKFEKRYPFLLHNISPKSNTRTYLSNEITYDEL